MRVLLVEDDLDLADALSQVLSPRGFQLICCADGLEALGIARRKQFDAILLDLSLPGIDGLEILRRLRDDASDIPILVITARGAVDERITGLNAGADDYISKPFDVNEVEARLRALYRRHVGKEELVCGMLRIDAITGVAHVGHLPISLPPREAILLKQLMVNSGAVVARDVLERAVFGDDTPHLEVLVHRLRKRLVGSATDLVSLRGVGYMLIDEALSRRSD